MIRSGEAGCFGAFVRKCIRENCPRVQGLKSRKYSAFSQVQQEKLRKMQVLLAETSHASRAC